MSVEDLATLSRTPGAGLGSSRHRPADEEIAQVVQSLAELGVQWVTMIGGNDSAETLHRLNVAADVSHISLGTVGIPKTIDNDLPAMDHCPGYGSAARYMALSVREAGLDTAAMRRTDPVKIVEVMGRYAGWLAASAVLGRERPGDAPRQGHVSAHENQVKTHGHGGDHGPAIGPGGCFVLVQGGRGLAERHAAKKPVEGHKGHDKASEDPDLGRLRQD